MSKIGPGDALARRITELAADRYERETNPPMISIVPGGITWADAIPTWEFLGRQTNVQQPEPRKPDPPDTRTDVEKRFSGLIWDDEK